LRANRQVTVLWRKIEPGRPGILVLDNPPLSIQLRRPLRSAPGEPIVRAQKPVWYRPAYGYAAAVVCVALAVCVAPSAPRALSFRQAIDQTDRDAQLPLERFAVEAGDPPVAPSQPQSQLQSPLQPATQSSQPQPDSCMQAAARGGSKQAQIGVAKLHTLGWAPGARGYYRKIEDWKNWT
jgi:hypothetical protein